MSELVAKNGGSALALLAAQMGNAQEVAESCTGGNFLPQLRFFAPLSAQAKAEAIGANRYGLLVDNEIDTDYGKEVEIFVCGMRFRGSCEIDGETFVTFNGDTDFYALCLQRSENNDRDFNPLAGRELLVWLPESELFATFLFANKTMRRTSNSKFKNILGKSVNCKQKTITVGTNDYQTPTIHVIREGGLTGDDIPYDKLKAAVDLFNHTEDKLPQEAGDDDGDDR